MLYSGKQKRKPEKGLHKCRHFDNTYAIGSSLK